MKSCEWRLPFPSLIFFFFLFFLPRVLKPFSVHVSSPSSTVAASWSAAADGLLLPPLLHPFTLSLLVTPAGTRTEQESKSLHSLRKPKSKQTPEKRVQLHEVETESSDATPLREVRSASSLCTRAFSHEKPTNTHNNRYTETHNSASTQSADTPLWIHQDEPKLYPTVRTSLRSKVNKHSR